MGEKTQIFEKLENSQMKITLTDLRRSKPKLAVENLLRNNPVWSTESPKASELGGADHVKK